MLNLGVDELAEMACMHRNTVTGNPHSVQIQNAMHDIVKVLAAASRVNSDRDRTLFWFINHPIADFEYQTPAELVRAGKAKVVIKYLNSLEGGATG